MTVTKKNSSPGRARNKPLKPLRAGMPGESGCTCGDDTRVLPTNFAREAAGAASTRHSPRPLLRVAPRPLLRVAPRSLGRSFMHNSGAIAPRGRGRIYEARHCEERSDEAIQSYSGTLDCFASLAMTDLRFDHLAPRAGRGRRVASGEGASPQGRARGGAPHPNPLRASSARLGPARGEREKLGSRWGLHVRGDDWWNAIPPR
jgi:hypothetical protein